MFEPKDDPKAIGNEVPAFPPSLLPPGSRRLHYWYWALIFALTVSVGFGPLFVFIDQVNGRHGQLASVVAFFVLPVWLASLVGARLPEGYYRCHPFERRGRLYEMLGVRYFRMLVPHGDGINWLVRRSQPGYRVVRDRLTLTDYEARTRAAEAFHLGCLLVMAPAAVYATFAGWSGMALWLTLPGIPLHLYPVLLQRYTRARMARALARPVVDSG
ncbi:MAG TPA: hypothetical protein VFV95_18195 [Vicinamibacterales bacterium]|nr:hypothetical protein [Vicinamibacterales bacterium]